MRIIAQRTLASIPSLFIRHLGHRRSLDEHRRAILTHDRGQCWNAPAGVLLRPVARYDPAMPTGAIRRILWIFVLLPGAGAAPAERPPITFNTNFEGASLGKIEILGETAFRCYVLGQH